MIKWVTVGSSTIAILVLLVIAAFYHITGVTRAAEIRDDVFQVYNENALDRIGANMTLFETEIGLVSVDAHLAPLAKRARKKILHKSDSKILAVFNTHWHPDHTGGNKTFTSEAEIIAHENVKAILSRKHEGFGLTKPGSKHEFEPVVQSALPEVLIRDVEVTFTKYGSRFRAVHYPSAHTDGDLVIFAPEYDVVVLGDLVWPGSYPFIDVHNGGSAPGLRDALTNIIATTDNNQLFAIGHGEPMTRFELSKYLEMINASIDHVTREKSRGKTLKDIQESGLPDELTRWESALVPSSEWIKMVFETL